MIRNKDEIKKKMEEDLNKVKEKFFADIDTAESEFTIDYIEEIMSKFRFETNQILLDKMNEIFKQIDESSIIAKKNNK